MSISDLMEAMAAKGATLDVILMAVRALEVEQGKAAEKRAQAAERKRRQRERDCHATVTGQSEDSPAQPLSRPPNEIKSNPPTHTPGNISRTRKGFPIPVGITAEQWTSFCGQRKKKLNDHAYSLLCGKLETLARDGWPPGEMIDLAIERGWETVFAPKENRNGNRPENTNPRQSGSGRHHGRDGFINALREAADRQAAHPPP